MQQTIEGQRGSIFAQALDEVAAASERLLSQLQTQAPPRNREAEAARARARSLARFGD